MSLKKTLFALLIVTLLIMASCSDSTNPSGDGGNTTEPGGGQNGWPSQLLGNYHLSGWGKPSGIDGIHWEESTVGNFQILMITFTSATVSTADNIRSSLSSMGFSGNLQLISVNTWYGTYTSSDSSYAVVIAYGLTGGYFRMGRPL